MKYVNHPPPLPPLLLSRQTEGPGQHGAAALWPVHQQLPAAAGPQHWRVQRQLHTEPLMTPITNLLLLILFH